ncbi:sugar phosphate isomerase/epimerase family protein [Arthrobacter mobilis]|uniref:Sugar phosphate isomerase/epimerase n=1 Tax=Arthrobacter mobilis TaxID=2724944 RepID=A0A7X6HFQ7_9MICC|nr:sugar phosphate isomerase/epimerase family protein [Arthrobacter mobilis]NKX55545.1 sugar phosphate isomerase/epimerase [Arthrobacter mobilis]
MDISRCSINSTTVRSASLDQLIDLAIDNDIAGIGLWRDVYAPLGVTRSAELVRSSGVRVTSICRGGMFPYRDGEEKARILEDNLRAIEEAHAFGAECLVLVCGGPNGLGLDAARAQIREGMEDLAGHAQSAGVKLAVEPMHPMMVTERSAIASLAEANDLVESLDHPSVGIALDAYHVWWDARLRQEVLRAGGKLLTVQVCDWVLPLTGLLSGRGMPGEGSIDLTSFVRLCEEAGYDGLIEVEVLSDLWWSRPYPQALKAALDGFAGI